MLCWCVCSQTYTLCCGYVHGAGDKRQTLVHADLQVHHPGAQRPKHTFSYPYLSLRKLANPLTLHRSVHKSRKKKHTRPTGFRETSDMCAKDNIFEMYLQIFSFVWNAFQTIIGTLTALWRVCWLTFVVVSCLVSQTFDKNSIPNVQHSRRGLCLNRQRLSLLFWQIKSFLPDEEHLF